MSCIAKQRCDICWTEKKIEKAEILQPNRIPDFTFLFSSTLILLAHGMDARDTSNCPSII